MEHSFPMEGDRFFTITENSGVITLEVFKKIQVALGKVEQVSIFQQTMTPQEAETFSGVLQEIARKLLGIPPKWAAQESTPIPEMQWQNLRLLPSVTVPVPTDADALKGDVIAQIQAMYLQELKWAMPWDQKWDTNHKIQKLSEMLMSLALYDRPAPRSDRGTENWISALIAYAQAQKDDALFMLLNVAALGIAESSSFQDVAAIMLSMMQEETSPPDTGVTTEDIKDVLARLTQLPGFQDALRLAQGGMMTPFENAPVIGGPMVEKFVFPEGGVIRPLTGLKDFSFSPPDPKDAAAIKRIYDIITKVEKDETAED